MAEILILAFDTYGADSTEDRFAYKLGHVIDIKPDGHGWGSSECLPKFLLVKLPGVSVEAVQKFLALKMDYSQPASPVQAGIRNWKLDVNGIPTAVRNALLTTGVITVNKAATFEGYMKLVT